MLCLRAASAEPLYIPKIIPVCAVFVLPSGDEICGYKDLDDWKKVLEADAELVAIRVELAAEKERSSLLEQREETWRKQVRLHAHSIELLEGRKKALTDELIKLDEKYQNERVKPRWGNPLAWALAAVSTSVLAGVLVAKLVD